MPHEAPPARCYLLTFRTYGTWLHGDPRGSVNRNNNVPGEPLIPPSLHWERMQRMRMKGPSVEFNDDRRYTCAEAFRVLAGDRKWEIFALNVRTNHVHAVVQSKALPEDVITDMKAAATKALRKARLVDPDAQVWSRGGSRVALNTREAVERACRYVVEQQGVGLGQTPAPF